MANLFIDSIIEFNQYDISTDEDIFETILEKRKDNWDRERFYLKYIPISEVSKYNFDDINSLRKYRDDCVSYMSPLKGMGGCNLRKETLEKDIRYAGIKLSDPYGKIPGVFDVRSNIMTYSPIFPFFYEERDLVKFAKDTYFTSIPFEAILMSQINFATEFYIHTGNYNDAKDIANYGSYIFERVSKDEMIEYATNPKLGEKIRKRCL